MKVSDYILKTRDGKRIRKATKVTLDNGQEIRFIEHISNKEAIKNAKRYLRNG